MHPALAADRLRSAARAMSALKSWRKAQMVTDPVSGDRRPMRLTDVPRLYHVPTSTWHQWEQTPGDDEFRCPTPANMARICGEITKGAVSPADFYPPVNVPRETASGG